MEGPLISRTENREHYSRRQGEQGETAGEGKIKTTGTTSPASTVR